MHFIQILYAEHTSIGMMKRDPMNPMHSSLPFVPTQTLLTYKDRMEQQHQKQLAKMIEYNANYHLLNDCLTQELLSRQSASSTFNLFDLSPSSSSKIKMEPIYNTNDSQTATAPKAEPEDEEQAAQALVGLKYRHILDLNRNESALRYWESSDEERVKMEMMNMNPIHVKQESVNAIDLGSDLSTNSLTTSSVKTEYPTDQRINFDSFPAVNINFSAFGNGKVCKPKSQTIRKQHVCSYDSCSYTTNNYAHLTKHIRTHTGHRPFKCEHIGCHKAFKQKSNLKTHQRIHSGARPFECKECGNRFTQRSSLVQHERIHSGIKPFVCNICNKAFKRKDHLHSHFRVHTGEKKHKCDWIGCTKRFATPQQLRLHRMDHTGERPFSCIVCSKSFKTRSLLNRHKNIHLKIKPYVCLVCNKRFTRKTHVKKHKCKGYNQ